MLIALLLPIKIADGLVIHFLLLFLLLFILRYYYDTNIIRIEICLILLSDAIALILFQGFVVAIQVLLVIRIIQSGLHTTLPILIPTLL